MRQRIPLNNDWHFTPNCTDGFLRGEDGAFETVRLPHTCAETPYDYFDESIYQMVSGYRRTLHVPADWAGRRAELHIGGAAHLARVYMDGVQIGEHRCGYTAFTVDLTPHIKPGGDHVLAVSVDSRETLDQPPFGYVIDYMTYGGLYREVWLEVHDSAHIADVFARPRVTDFGGAHSPLLRGTVTSDVALRGVEGGGFSLRQTLRDETDRTVAQRTFPAAAQGTCTLEAPDIRLWDIDDPHLYTLETELLRGDEALDTHTVRIGFREMAWRRDGFYLNGRRVMLRGLNRHQSWPYVGYAMPAAAQRLDADILKNELGCNAVRTSHYPQSHHFIDRCDELGLLVFTEIPGWQHIGGAVWQDRALANVAEMVEQYRNHPSIVLWGVRINESVDNDDLYARTNALCRRLDPTRPTGGVRCHKKSSLLEDVYTYNDFFHDGTNGGCEPKKAVTSDMEKPYLISEYNGHMFPTKMFDSENHTTEHTLRHARVLNDAAAAGDIVGTFGWCMFDYNTHRDFGSGDRICYHGVMDMYRNPKDAAAVYAAQQGDTPVLAVTSRMDIGEHPSGNMGKVFVLSNADAVRMYKNGNFIKEYPTSGGDYPALAHGPILLDDYIGDAIAKGEGYGPTQAGLVRDMLNHSAVHGFSHLPPRILAKAARAMAQYRMTFSDAYRLYGKYIGSWGGSATVYRFEAVKDGKVVQTLERSPVTAVHLEADVDHTALREGDTYDVATVRIRLCDQNGSRLPFYNGSVTASAEGPIRIIGPAAVQLRGGCGGTYVRTTGESGEAILTLQSDQGGTVTLRFTVQIDSKEDSHE